MSKFDINKAMGDDTEEEIIIKRCSSKEEVLKEITKTLNLIENKEKAKQNKSRDITEAGLEKKLEKKLKKTIINKSDDSVFEGICDTFKNVVSATGRNPEAGMCILLDKEGNLNMSVLNLETKEKVVSFLYTLIEEVKKAYEEKDNL